MNRIKFRVPFSTGVLWVEAVQMQDEVIADVGTRWESTPLGPWQGQLPLNGLDLKAAVTGNLANILGQASSLPDEARTPAALARIATALADAQVEG